MTNLLARTVAINNLPLLPHLPQRVALPTPVREESLPFSVRLVRSEDDLEKAVTIRHAMYARHVPHLGETLRNPEAYDFADDCDVLLAESKLDGSSLGTMRIHTNFSRPLPLEQSVDLPNWLQGQSLAEATRLGIGAEKVAPIVKHMLFKAYFHYCVANGIDWMVITARKPLDRMYRGLLFRDVFPEAGFIPMRHVGDIPHRVMAFNIPGAEQCWREANHPLYDFVVLTDHPDMDLNPALPAMAPTSRFEGMSIQ